MKKLNILCLIAFLSTNGVAQNPEWINHLSVTSFPPSFTSLATDNNHMWVGTDSGLIRVNMFDGSDTIFTTSNSGLPANYINCVEVDADGNKWIGTDLGLIYYDGINWTVFDTLNLVAPFWEVPMRVRNIAIDPNGDIWCVIKQTNLFLQLYKYDGSILTNPSNDTSAPSIRNVQTLDRNPYNGDLWMYYNPSFGGDNRVMKYDGIDNWESWAQLDFGSGGFNNVVFDDQGNTWFGTSYGNLAKYDGTSWTINSSLPGQYVSSTAIDKNEDLWFGTVNEGLIKYDYTNWTVYDTANSDIPANDVKIVVVDKNNNKWIISADTVNWYLSVYQEGGVNLNIGESISEGHKANLLLFPNPFISSTTIQYDVSGSEYIKLQLLNPLGQVIGTLVNEKQSKGTYQISIDASQLPQGLSFCKLSTSNSVKVRKLLVIKY